MSTDLDRNMVRGQVEKDLRHLERRIPPLSTPLELSLHT